MRLAPLFVQLMLLLFMELCSAYFVSLLSWRPLSWPVQAPFRGLTGKSAVAQWGSSLMKRSALNRARSHTVSCLEFPSSPAAVGATESRGAASEGTSHIVRWDRGASAFPGAAAPPTVPAGATRAEPCASAAGKSLTSSCISRMRLTLTLSNNHVYACITDKTGQHTFAFASSRDKSLKARLPPVKRQRSPISRPHGGTVAAAAAVGELVAVRGQRSGIFKVYFDRKKYRYVGRVAALAAAARDAGLEF